MSDVKVLPGQLKLPGMPGRIAALFADTEDEMAVAVFEFKCRRCGGLFDGSSTALKNADVFLLAALRPDFREAVEKAGTIDLTSPFAPGGTGIHKCGDGNTGVGDLAGYREQ